jgi:hypothetical protein
VLVAQINNIWAEVVSMSLVIADFYTCFFPEIDPNTKGSDGSNLYLSLASISTAHGQTGAGDGIDHGQRI